MIIQLQKGDGAPDWVKCIRPDGSETEGPLLPFCVYHDLAHFVVESKLGVRDGYWGRLAEGFSFSDYDLPDDQRPFQISAEGMRAEYLATLVQTAAGTGVWNIQYEEMLKKAADSVGNPFPETPSADLKTEWIAATQQLYDAWDGLKAGERMELRFNY